MNALARAIVDKRRLDNITQVELCERFGWHETKLSRIENGHAKPYKDLALIAKWLGITVEDAYALLEEPVDVGGNTPAVSDLAAEMAGYREEVADMRAMLGELMSMQQTSVSGVIANMLVERRVQQSMTMHEVALLLNVSTSTLLRLESGIAAYQVYATQIADFLDVPVDDLKQAVKLGDDGYRGSPARPPPPPPNGD